MKRLLIILAVLGVLAAVVNDAGRYLTTAYDLDAATNDIVSKAAQAAKGARGDRNVAGGLAMQVAATYGITVYGYDQNTAQVHVWTQAPVSGTLIWGPAHNLLARQPISTPLLIQDDATGFIN